MDPLGLARATLGTLSSSSCITLQVAALPRQPWLLGVGFTERLSKCQGTLRGLVEVKASSPKLGRAVLRVSLRVQRGGRRPAVLFSTQCQLA